MKQLHTVCYISNASPNLSEAEIEEIFETTYTNNTANNVSGILLYNLGHFFQVIEGEVQHIIDLFDNKISEDPRHQDIYIVYNKATSTPVFLDYSAKFNIVKTHDDLEKIKKYLLSVRTSTSNKLTRLLRPFVLFDTIT